MLDTFLLFALLGGYPKIFLVCLILVFDDKTKNFEC